MTLRSRAFAGVAMAVVANWLTGQSLFAESVIGNFSANGINLSTEVIAGFEGVGSTLAADFDQPPPDIEIGTLDFLGPVVVTSNAATKTPADGAAKDLAEIMVTTQFNFGTATTPDRLSFTADGRVSAINALNSAGNPSAARAVATANLRFFIDAGFGGAPPAGGVAGILALPGLPPLAAHEISKRVEILENNATIAAVEAGNGPLDVPLRAGSAYRVQINYFAEAPFGVDPPFHFQWEAPINFMPEPATGGSLAFLVVAAAHLRRRAGSAAGTGVLTATAAAARR